MERKPEVVLSVAFALVLICAAGFAQETRPPIQVDPGPLDQKRQELGIPRVEYAPPLLTNPQVSVMDAVRSALAHDPNIRLAETGVNLQQGVVQETSGQFDTVLFGDFSFQFTQNELTAAQLKGETDKRQQGREEIERGIEQLDNEEAILAEIERLQADPDNYLSDVPEVQSQVDVINLLIEDAEDPLVKQGLIDQRTLLIERLRQAQVAKVAKTNEELSKSMERLRKLGAVPTVDQRFDGSIDMRVFKPTRIGVDLGAFLTVTGESTNWRGKERPSEVGGKGITDFYQAEAGVNFDVPLARGAGWETTTARERASNVDLEASRLYLQHASSQSVLSVVQAYWNVVAAAQTVAAYEESGRLQNQLVDITRALIEGDEMAAAELPRIQASQASIAGTLAAVRRNLYDARVQLAQSMGIRVESEANVPQPTSELPVPATVDELRTIDPSLLAASAVDRRFDYLGSRKLQDSGGILLRAAYLDLKPVVDLSAAMKYTAVGESSSIRMGLERVLNHKWIGPSTKLGLTVEYPLGNNVQKGRFAQAQATMDERTITADNLARVIRANVIVTWEALVEAAASARASEDAIRFYRELVDSEVEKLRLGSSTLIDTILTEQRRTDAMLGYIAARQQYAQLLAQLRYESGTLVETTPEGNRVDPESLTRPPAAGTR